MPTLRPADLAHEHGLSTQAVRNYERDGFLPQADRTASGYRVYTEVHRAALSTYLALVPGFGRAAAGQIMNAVHDGDVAAALTAVDREHGRALQDRDTVATVRRAVEHLVTDSDDALDGLPWTIGELAQRLRITAATLRTWEDVGILMPERNRATGYRSYGGDDIRDAELAHLLRRGHYPLDTIATVVRQIRSAGSTDALAQALDGWERASITRGLQMLDAAGELSRYVRLHG